MNSLRLLNDRPLQYYSARIPKLSDVPPSSVSDIPRWRELAREAAEGGEVLKNLRRYSVVRSIVDTNDYFHGLAYLDEILSAIGNFQKWSLSDLQHIATELDSLGSPICYKYRRFGTATPLSLRYLATALDIHQRFGFTELSRVCEIGAGFGGQILVLARLKPLDTYDVHDLPEVAGLTLRYLREFGVNAVAKDFSGHYVAHLEYDLVISNYALSELQRDAQLHFIERVVRRSKKGVRTLEFARRAADVWIDPARISELSH